VIRNGLQWKDAPGDPVQSLRPLDRRCVFERILAGLAGEGSRPDPSQSASNGRQPAEKRERSRCIGRTKGGLHSKLHVVSDEQVKPMILILTEGQMSHHFPHRTERAWDQGVLSAD
jgi:hypothetical protein